MSRAVIVPNDLRDAIYEKVDEAILLAPNATSDREHYYQQLLNYFDEHGCIPDFTLLKE